MFVLVLLAVSAGAYAAEATLAVVNARIWTGNPERPRAEAIAISGERILAVGSRDEILKLVPPSARIVDGGGGMLTPGFIDAHFHVFHYKRSSHPPLNLRFRNRAEFIEAVSNYAANVPKGTWILGLDWDERLYGSELPSRHWIDRFTPEHPVWLRRVNGDAGLANSAALHAAGITREIKEQPRGAVVRDARGEPTGLLRGGPMWLVDAALVEHNRQSARLAHPGAPFNDSFKAQNDDRIVEEIIRRLPEAGITSVHHTGGWEDLLLLQRLHREGRLRVRVYACPELNAWTRLRDYVAEHGRGDGWLRWDCLKGFGAMSKGDCHAWVAGAARAGLQVMVHVEKEPGLEGLLDIYDRVRREQNLRDPRFRVEHAHHMPPNIIRQYARAGVIASVQPPLLAHIDRRAGATRPLPYPWREVLEAGVVIAFGTDSIASSFLTPPLESIRMALERPGPDGTALSLDQALRAYTSDAAYAEFAEHEKGTLAPGKLADFVLFDCDLARLPTHLLAQAGVRMTMVGGKVVYELN